MSADTGKIFNAVQETYAVKPNPDLGTFLRKVRADKGRRRGGWRWRIIVKIWRLILELR